MTETQNMPWKRLAVEAIAIVASILLAFAIDAWWADREFDQWQSAQLSALREEFSANLEGLGTVVQDHNSSATSLESLITQIRASDDNTPLTVSNADLTPLVAWRTSDISTGTLDALLSSGKLADIRNFMIRRALAAWPSEVGDAQEDEELARDFVEQVVAKVLLGQGILEHAYRSRPIVGDPGEEIGAHSSISITPELIDIVTIRIIHSKMASRSISNLRIRIREILALIDAEFEGV